MIMISRGLIRRHTFILAITRDVPTWYRMEEYVSGMVLKLRLAVLKNVPIGHLREEFVRGTVHRGQKRLAAIKDVQIASLEEEFVEGMVLRERLAAMKDVPT